MLKVKATVSVRYATPTTKRRLDIIEGKIYDDQEIAKDLLYKGWGIQVEEQPIKKADYSGAIPSKEVSPTPKRKYKKKEGGE